MTSRKSETLASSLISGINMAMAQLVDIWDSIGIMEEQRVERMLTVKKHIEDLLRDMITEEESLRHRIKSSIVISQKQLEAICEEMKEGPYKLEEGLTILQTEKNLRYRLEALQKEKNDRLRDLKALQLEDEELCVQLCSTPYYVPSNTVPSNEQLKALREHIQDLTAERRSRLAVFTALRKDIALLASEMGHDPETSLEREAVSDDPDVFLLTHDNIKALQLLVGQLGVKKGSLILTRDKLKERAMSLWSRLDCPEKDGGFPLDTQGTLTNDISRWQNEVDRLEELQKAHLEDVIEKARLELMDMWDKCLFGPEQREAFNCYFCDVNYTEELLLLHDAELVKLKEYQEKTRPLLEALEKWEKNWVLFQDFERKASDPSRFSNRGGALLKETKERTKVQKMLPKLEEEMKGAVDAWEKSQGSAFLVRGLKLMDYISVQREEYKQQKDKEKNERMTKKTENTPFKTPTKRPPTGASGATPNKTRKQTPNQTVLRSVSVSSLSSASSTYLSVPSGKPPVGSAKKNKIETSLRTPLQVFNCTAEQIPGITYSDFTSELSKKASQEAVLNSTVLLDVEKGN
ncbi:protein regulator of cytokinesis 1 isoform X1 [Alosa sapidissima]|uniref:protein regulator of cytokinesis 1 isoform X1 n=1 Tax=Alosa sapidissima TaxID=34773 RepID=UPI001C0A225C|nr:protein regulator of cytokinesis 1 isoform X1 [Alosa sapidissima]